MCSPGDSWSAQGQVATPVQSGDQRGVQKDYEAHIVGFGSSFKSDVQVFVPFFCGALGEAVDGQYWPPEVQQGAQGCKSLSLSLTPLPPLKKRVL